MEPLSFFGRFAQKLIVSCFFSQIHLFKKRRNNEVATVMLQVTPSFYTNFSNNSLFISANTYEKYIVSKENCFAHHVDKMCFLPNCRYHIILIGNINELLQKLNSFCINYQHVDCLSTFFKYGFNGKIVIESGQLFDNLQRVFHFNQQNRSGENAQHCEKETLQEKYEKHLLSSFQKSKSTQTTGSVFADWIEQVKKTKFELGLIKVVDCFPDGHDSYTSKLVSFKIKPL